MQRPGGGQGDREDARPQKTLRLAHKTQRCTPKAVENVLDLCRPGKIGEAKNAMVIIVLQTLIAGWSAEPICCGVRHGRQP